MKPTVIKNFEIYFMEINGIIFAHAVPPHKTVVAEYYGKVGIDLFILRISTYYYFSFTILLSFSIDIQTIVK